MQKLRTQIDANLIETKEKETELYCEINNAKKNLEEYKSKYEAENKILKIRNDRAQGSALELELEVQKLRAQIDENLIETEEKETALHCEINNAKKNLEGYKSKYEAENKILKIRTDRAQGSALESELEVQKLRAQIDANLIETKEKETELYCEINNAKKNLEEYKSKYEAENKKNKELLENIEELKQQMKKLEIINSAKSVMHIEVKKIFEYKGNIIKESIETNKPTDMRKFPDLIKNVETTGPFNIKKSPDLIKNIETTKSFNIRKFPDLSKNIETIEPLNMKKFPEKIKNTDVTIPAEVIISTEVVKPPGKAKAVKANN